MSIGERIIETALKNGATIAGIASMEPLKVSPSHIIYNQLKDHVAYDTVRDDKTLPDNEFLAHNEDSPEKIFNWPDTVRSILVIGLSHPEDKPELDWWDGRGTSGNRILIDIIKRTSCQIENILRVKNSKLHYYVEKGGIFLKDAAVLAGLGCIGKNNMLINPSYGPRIRLRALFIETEVHPTGPISFYPCDECKVYCRSVCPENAMNEKATFFNSIDYSECLPGIDGHYNREICNVRMEKDVAASVKKNKYGKKISIKFCRKCEFICPVGK